MELEFGHGFIPRIGKDNYKAGDRCSVLPPTAAYLADYLTSG